MIVLYAAVRTGKSPRVGRVRGEKEPYCGRFEMLAAIRANIFHPLIIAYGQRRNCGNDARHNDGEGYPYTRNSPNNRSRNLRQSTKST